MTRETRMRTGRTPWCSGPSRYYQRNNTSENSRHPYLGTNKVVVSELLRVPEEVVDHFHSRSTLLAVQIGLARPVAGARAIDEGRLVVEVGELKANGGMNQSS